MTLGPQTLLQDRYLIDAVIGQGGMGAVYRAADTRLRVSCAIKENLASHRYSNRASELARQFEHEATILAALHHSNLPRVTDYFFVDDNQYLVMDYVEGEDLEARLRRAGPMAEAEAQRLAKQVCDALTYLHTCPDTPVIHRDVKPGNIKITSAGRVMLVDFGLSKLHDPNVSTITGAKGWSSGFSPPEQYDFGRTDPRSDEYALAATLYVLLTGETPADGFQRRLGYATLKPLNELNATLSERTVDAIHRAMAVESADRFETVEEFRAALIGEKPSVSTTRSTLSAGSPSMLAKLAILVSKSDRKYPLKTANNVIGRRNRQTGEVPEIDLYEEPDGDTVSRKHALVYAHAGEWYLQPHGEHKNVIKINGQLVTGMGLPLKHGDEVQVGAVVLKFQHH